MIRFKFAPDKARAALHWMAHKRPGIDLHAALKTCYFADKSHLNAHGRPIFGATYRAMKFGPVPLEIYEMAKGEPMWLAELGADMFPWQLNGFKLHLHCNEDVDTSSLSDSDIEHLEAAFKTSISLTFNERTAATHGHDWQKAQLGLMAYEDMLEDRPDKAGIVDYLEENARFIRL
ncbi:type II toxin-antitoxin system antitoxin SocA domain-containing protein [Xanthobacteraceae bacterium A53D]